MSGLIPAASLVAQIGVDGEVAAGAKLAAFGGQVDQVAARQVASAGKIGGAFRALDSQLGAFGLPFGGALAQVSKGLEHTEQSGRGFASFLTNLGGRIAVAGALGLATVGVESVHLADQQELAQARMGTAITNTGKTVGGYTGLIASNNAAMEKLGFTHAQTETSVADLTNATGNATKGLKDSALAADISAGRHEALAYGTNILMKVETGHVNLLGRLGINIKDASGHIIDQQTALARLSALYGGQAAAAADTFAGKMKTLSAEGQDLGASFGQALIPKIEGAASAAQHGVLGFEAANSALGGWLGKTVAVGAAIPVAVFASEKLAAAAKSVGAATSGAYTGLAAQLGITQAAVPVNTELAAAQEAVAAAEANLAEASAAAEGPLAALAETAGVLTPEMTAEAEAATALATANAALASTEAEVAAATGAEAAGFSLLTTSLAGVAVGAGIVYGGMKILEAIQPNFGQKIDKEGKLAGQALQQTGRVSTEQARQMQTDFGVSANAVEVYKEALLAGVPANEAFAAAVKANATNGAAFTPELRLWTNDINTYVGSLDPAARLSTQLSDAQRKLTADMESGHAPASQLAADQQAVTQASENLASVQSVVDDATNAGTAAARSHSAALSAEAAAFDGVAQSASQAAAAVSQMATAGFASERATIDQHRVTADLTNATAALTAGNKTLGGGGGGGSGSHKSVAQAALDQSQKELTLRDALLKVGDETAAIASAQHQLSAARASDQQAIAAQTAAEQNLETVLHGVAATSQLALSAQEDLQKSQLDAQSATLDVGDAQRQLATDQKTASDDQVVSTKSVRDAEARLAADRAANADPSKLVSDETAVAAAKTASASTQQADNEKVARSEIALSEARLRQKDVLAQVSAAQRTYSGDLHGFGADSAEAKTAQDALTTANQGATSANDQLSSAVRGVRDALDQTSTNALALQRAQDDLNGSLIAIGGSGGGGGSAGSAGKALQNYQTLVDAAATAAQADAQNVGDQFAAATHNAAIGEQAYLGVLQSLAKQYPAIDAALAPAIAAAQTALANFAGTPLLPNPTVAPHPKKLPQAHAAGGTMAPGDYGIAGEAGMPELLYAKPGGGIDILSGPHTQQVLGAPGNPGKGPAAPTINIGVINARDDQDVARVIADQQRRAHLLSTISL